MRELGLLFSLGSISAALIGCGNKDDKPKPPASPDAVDSLPGYDGVLRSQHYAGYASVSEDSTDTTNQLFYYFVKAEENYSDDTPTLIWLNGGPGASSLMGLFVENLGPQSVTADGHLKENPDRMSKKYNMMAVDNPVGAGFSYTNNKAYVKNEEEMRAQFVQGLRSFFKLHPELLVHPLWVTGESYAGKYIPNIVHELDAQITKDKANGGQFANLKLHGMMLGNGVYNMTAQVTTITDFAYYQGIIDEHTRDLGKKNESACVEKIHAGYKMAGQFCENATVRWLYWQVAQIPMYYDLGLKDMDLDSITASMSSWLSRDDVKKALHTTGHTWVNNDEVGPVADAINDDWTIDVTPLIAEATEKGYRVALYNGVRDGSMCNHLANTKALLEMDKHWKYKGQYAAASEDIMWFQKGKNKKRVAGYHRIVNGFSFTKLLNTGHLVPTVIPDEFHTYVDWVTGYRKPADEVEDGIIV